MSQGPVISSDLRLALDLAAYADKASLPRFRATDLRIDTKPDRSYVTDADLAVEATIRAHLTQERPDDAFHGEETGTAGSSSRRWVVDPIDGTSNFLRGVANWATLIALVIDDEPRIGVVSAPALGVTWFAEVGAGAWRRNGTADPTPIRVSRVRGIADASLSFQSVAQWRDADRLADLLALCERVWRDRAYGDMWAYMALAEGLLDIVAEFDVKPYDLAALVPIVREAGGRFTDIDGAERIDTLSSLATNGELHDQVLAALDGTPNT